MHDQVYNRLYFARPSCDPSFLMSQKRRTAPDHTYVSKRSKSIQEVIEINSDDEDLQKSSNEPQPHIQESLSICALRRLLREVEEVCLVHVTQYLDLGFSTKIYINFI
jgi:hypothetical protein